MFANPKWPANPDYVIYTNSVAAASPQSTLIFGSDIGDYGLRYVGHIIPTVSGMYSFQILHDDSGRFSLSTDESAAHATQLLNVENSTAAANSGPILLLAGQAYYFEGLMQEGGGGDRLSVLWELPGATSYTEIPSANLAFCTALAITTQPASVSGAEMQVTFSVGTTADGVAEAAGELRYQWERSNDGGGTWDPIAGATDPSYSFYATCIDSDSQFRVNVSVVGDLFAVTSDPATVTVTDVDSTPPTVVYATGMASNLVQILFSKPLEQVSATTAANYEISDGIIVSDASLSADGRMVTLLLTSPLGAGTHTLTINGVGDLSCDPQTIADNTMVDFSYNCQDGLVQWDIFLNDPSAGGNTFAATLFANPKWPDNPDLLFMTNILEGSYTTMMGGVDQNNYGMRFVGQIVPTVSGTYHFQMTDDDSGRFALSTDWNAVNAEMLLNIDGTCCGTYTTTGVQLEAGHAYYFEALLQEGGGGDHLEIRWDTPDAPGTFVTIPSANLAYCYDAYVSVPPVSQTVKNADPATFNVGVTALGAAQAPGKLHYQWQRSDDSGATWNDIAGATGTSYTLPLATQADNGAQFRAVATVAGDLLTVTSAPATLTVENSPYVTDVVVAGPSTIFVLFSTDMDSTSALAAGNYTLDQGLSVTTASFAPDMAQNGSQSAVRLDLDGSLTLSTTYTLTVQDVADASLVVINPNPTVKTIQLGTGTGGEIFADFNAGAPANAQISGNAVVEDGVLKLTQEAPSVFGAIVFDTPNCGQQPINGFQASFQMAIFHNTVVGANPADGFSFNVASDLPNPPVYGGVEAGVGTGFSVAVELYPPNTPRIDVKWAGQVVASFTNQVTQMTANGVFIPVTMSMTPDGVFNMTLDGTNIFTDVQTPWQPLSGQFGIFARTGGSYANQWFDDIRINTVQNYGPVALLQDLPANLTVPEDQSATLSIALDGTPCFDIQWYSNGVAIAGANGVSYTTAPLVYTNNNGTEQYYAVAANDLGTVTSQTTTISVIQDVTGPHILYAIGLTPTNVAVVFDEPINQGPDGPTDPSLDWLVTDSSANPYDLVSSTVNSNNAAEVDLLVAESSALTPGQLYTVQASALGDDLAGWFGVIDRHGNPVEPNPATASFEVFTNYTGQVTGLPVMPTDQMLPLGSLSVRGFDVHLVQTTNSSFGANFNDMNLAEEVLAGTFTNQGPNTAGLPCFVEPGVINYSYEYLTIQYGHIQPDKPFPGIPNAAMPSTDWFVMESVAYVPLQPGVYRWGVNSDDNFRLLAPTNGLGTNAVLLGEANVPGGRGSADTAFTFVVNEAGLYPIRLTYEQGNGGANVEFWNWSLVDDSYVAINDADGIPAYRPPQDILANPIGPVTIAKDATSVSVCWPEVLGNCWYETVLQATDTLEVRSGRHGLDGCSHSRCHRGRRDLRHRALAIAGAV